MIDGERVRAPPLSSNPSPARGEGSEATIMSGIGNRELVSGNQELVGGKPVGFLSRSPLAGEGLGRGEALEQIEFAKMLRRKMTDAETLLWRHLRDHRLDGQKFRRQQPIGPYIVDFVHFGARLIVEADSGQHLQSAHDIQRDAWLCSQGFNMLRFWNDDILLHSDSVLEMIWQALRASPSPPTPLLHALRVREGRGEQSHDHVGHFASHQ